MSNENNSGFAGWDSQNILNEFHEENRIRQEEAQIRYQQRKKQKEEHRARIEAAAMKLCDTVESMEKVKSIEEIVQLAAVLNYCALALHAADSYAEYMPYTGLGLGFGI